METLHRTLVSTFFLEKASRDAAMLYSLLLSNSASMPKRSTGDARHLLRQHEHCMNVHMCCSSADDLAAMKWRAIYVDHRHLSEMSLLFASEENISEYNARLHDSGVQVPPSTNRVLQA